MGGVVWKWSTAGGGRGVYVWGGGRGGSVGIVYSWGVGGREGGETHRGC